MLLKMLTVVKKQVVKYNKNVIKIKIKIHFGVYDGCKCKIKLQNNCTSFCGKHRQIFPLFFSHLFSET